MPRKSTPEQQTVLDVLQQFRLIYGSMRRHFRMVEEQCGISGSHVWLIQEVCHSPGVGISELALRMGIHQSTCSLLVDKLVSQGYLSKHRREADHRRVGLHLEEKGEAVLARMPKPSAGILSDALSNLPAVVLKTLHINLEELLRNLPGKEDKYASVPLSDMLREEIDQKRNAP